MQPKKKIKTKSSTNFFVKAAILTFICFCLVSIIKLQIDYNHLAEHKSASEITIAEIEDNIEELSDQLARPFDDDYVREIARSRLNYRMPEEIIFYNDLIK